MKKAIITTVVALLSLTVAAQETYTTTRSASTTFFSTERSTEEITYGIEGGINFSTLTGDIDLDHRTGFNIGAVVNIPILESLYIKSGVRFSQKGAKYDSFDFKDYEGLDIKSTASYLEIPILASYRYNFDNSSQLQINVGPYLAFGVGGKTKIEVTDNSDANYEYYDGVEFDTFGDHGLLNRFDLGLEFSIGITLANQFYIGAGYDLGLLNIANDDFFDRLAEEEEAYHDISIKNGSWVINVGFTF